MGIEEDFYATIKLKTGEEIFAKIAASEEEDRTMLIISSPIVVSEIKNRSRTVGYKVEPWLKTTKDDMFIIQSKNNCNENANYLDSSFSRYLVPHVIGLVLCEIFEISQPPTPDHI